MSLSSAQINNTYSLFIVRPSETALDTQRVSDYLPDCSVWASVYKCSGSSPPSL